MPRPVCKTTSALAVATNCSNRNVVASVPQNISMSINVVSKSNIKYLLLFLYHISIHPSIASTTCLSNSLLEQLIIYLLSSYPTVAPSQPYIAHARKVLIDSADLFSMGEQMGWPTSAQGRKRPQVCHPEPCRGAKAASTIAQGRKGREHVSRGARAASTSNARAQRPRAGYRRTVQGRRGREHLQAQARWMCFPQTGAMKQYRAREGCGASEQVSWARAVEHGSCAELQNR